MDGRIHFTDIYRIPHACQLATLVITTVGALELVWFLSYGNG